MTAQAEERGTLYMPKKGNHWERTVEQAHAHLPPGAKAAISAILPQLDAEGRKHIDELAVSLRRREKQRDSNLRTDPKRRTLVGTRTTHDKADEYKRLAKEKGKTLNEWVNEALEEKAARQTTPTAPQDQIYKLKRIYPLGDLRIHKD